MTLVRKLLRSELPVHQLGMFSQLSGSGFSCCGDEVAQLARPNLSNSFVRFELTQTCKKNDAVSKVLCNVEDDAVLFVFPFRSNRLEPERIHAMPFPGLVFLLRTASQQISFGSQAVAHITLHNKFY